MFLRPLALTLSLLLLAGTAVSAPPCVLPVGVVMELTGPAGPYGQAAAKAVDLALADLNTAAGPGDCTFHAEIRDTQSEPTVAVDAARQLVALTHTPLLIGGIVSATTLPILTAVTGPAKVLQISPAASSARLTELGESMHGNGLFVRTITSDALQGTAAARHAIDQKLTDVVVIHANNDFGNGLTSEFERTFRALGGHLVGKVAYNEHQGSYDAEVTKALALHPKALYLVSTPVDGATIARAWIAAGGARRLLLNDGLNSADFIRAVGARYLEEAYGTSSGTVPSASSRYFADAFRSRAKDDPESPAADRSYDAAALGGLALLAARSRDGVGLRAGLSRVTDPKGEVIHAGAEEFRRARALLKSGRSLRYEGVIGPVSFDANGDIAGPFRLWRIQHGAVVTVAELSADAVSALRRQGPHP